MAALDEGESSDDEGGFASLFVDEDYVEESFEFGDCLSSSATTILCSQAASTDYDLTGQVVWPVSVFLSWFIAMRPELFRGQTVVELGAGCGLPGVLAARLGATTTVLTDGSSVVMRLLERQKEAFDAASYSGAGPIETLRLEWGTREGVEALQRKLNPAGEATLELKQRVRPSVFIGADVVCWPSCVIPLLETLKGFFLDLDDPFQGVMFIGYVCRATDTRDLFFTEAKRMGFSFEKISGEFFLPSPSSLSAADSTLEPGSSVEVAPEEPNQPHKGWPQNVQSQYDLELYRIALDPLNKDSALTPPALDFNGAGQAMPY
jgi:hypothetical protein